jgi:hypothetical protein
MKVTEVYNFLKPSLDQLTDPEKQMLCNKILADLDPARRKKKPTRKQQDLERVEYYSRKIRESKQRQKGS